MIEKRLLVLDDDPMVGKTVVSVAQSVGILAQYTSGPEEFFRLLEEWQPTHIALDLVMPEMDGVEVMGELARRGCRAGIIITSGQGGRVLDAAGRSATWHGLFIIAVLAKPFTLRALRHALADDTWNSGQAVARPASEGKAPADGGHVSAAELQGGLDNRELQLVYQPKVSCLTGELAGFEALVRWNHPERGTVPPDQFIPLAEETGLIDVLTDQVLELGLAWFSGLSSLSGPDGRRILPEELTSKLTLSVNISARTLGNTRLMETVSERCEALGVEPRRLIFELTETSAMEDPVVSLDLLTRLRLRGFHLSIDDFGTGHSSMLQLVRLPFSEVKVDKSFVMTAHLSQEHRTVIRSIVGLGHSLGLKCTAEGLEEPQVLEYLREIGCDYVQGHHIARPMPGEAVPKWILERYSGAIQ